MKQALIVGILFVSLLLKTTIFGSYNPITIRPELMVMVVIVIALREGSYAAITTGFIAGLLQDLLAGNTSLLGLGSLLMIMVGWASANAKPFMVENLALGGSVLAGFFGGFYTFFHAIINGALGIVSAPLADIVQVSTMTVIVSAIFFWPVHVAVHWLFERLPQTPTAFR